MEIETQYAVRLFFANASFVQVYYEAIANAIDADATEISIQVQFDGHIHDPKSLEISISDNGLGFTDERFERFRRLQEPQDAYHKGLGRLVFLQYFSHVEITSVYGEERRTFSFSNDFDGKSNVQPATAADARGTRLEFKGFLGSRLHTYDDLKPSALKQRLLEQFLPVLHSQRSKQESLNINIELKTDKENEQYELFSQVETLTTNDVPELKTRKVADSTVDAFSSIIIHYAILRDQSRPYYLTAASIDGRTVPLKLLSSRAMPEGCSALFLFESDLFTGKSDSARQRLILPEGVQEGALTRLLTREIAAILHDTLPEIATRNANMRAEIEEMYPHLIGLFDTDSVGLIDRKAALELAQSEFFRKQRQVLEGDPMDDATFENSLEISARALTEYVLYRNWIIRRLAKTPKSAREEVVHKLIVPQREEFDEANLVDGIYRNNAWLLDDKFMTFRTILSEATMKQVIKAITLDEDAPEDDGRPDISMIFSGDPERGEKVDVVVVELKRRRVDDKEGTYASVQLVKRARKLIDHCPNIQRAWYYAIIEIDDALSRLLQDMDWVPLFSKGTVLFRDYNLKRTSDGSAIPTPTFLLSFEAVVADAQARNHAFLELLKSRFRNNRALDNSTAAVSEQTETDKSDSDDSAGLGDDHSASGPGTLRRRG